MMHLWLVLLNELLVALLQKGLKPFLNSLYLLLSLLLELLVDGCHVLWHFLLLQLLQSSQGLQIFLLSHLSCEYISHNVLLIFLKGVKGFTQL